MATLRMGGGWTREGRTVGGLSSLKAPVADPVDLGLFKNST